MKRKGLAVFYIILSMFIVIIVGFMLMKFLYLEIEEVCTFEDQGTCCISIMDRCEAESGKCIIGGCEEPESQNKCGNETYCTLYPAASTTGMHACISEDCLSDVSKCSPVECTLAAFRYDPKNDEGVGTGKDWWLVLDTAKENMCCQVKETAGGLVKTCDTALQ